jgi:hypothetical protein
MAKKRKIVKVRNPFQLQLFKCSTCKRTYNNPFKHVCKVRQRGTK